LDEEAATGKKAGKAKKEKKIKDPNAPKRPPSAYILFQNEIREDIRAANPGIAYKDVLNVVSERWKNLSESEKKVSRPRPSEAPTDSATGLRGCLCRCSKRLQRGGLAVQGGRWCESVVLPACNWMLIVTRRIHPRSWPQSRPMTTHPPTRLRTNQT
jgi:hypothetical protein